MERLAPGESTEPAPTPGRMPPPGPGLPPRMPPRRPPPPPGPPEQTAPFGTLSIRVQPSDAEVLVDGERWRGPEGDTRLLVQVAEGSHRIEIRKQGYETYSGPIDVRRGETTTLNVSLPPSR